MNFLNDSIDDLLGGPMGEVRIEPIRAPVDYKPRDFTERCAKCGGTGSWRGRGQCFACKGKGQFSFKTSPETRAANRQKAADRKERNAQTSFEEFKAAHPVIAEWIETSTDFSFAVNMREAVEKYGSLTEGQLAACQRCVDKRNAARQERTDRLANAPVVSVSKIEDAFSAARSSGLIRLKLRLADFEFSPASATSSNPGAIYVKQDGTYIGKVAGGRFVCARSCSKETEQKVVDTIADPRAAAIAYGKETGSCSCCGRQLTDPVSVEAGIGPICATKWGM